MERHRSGRMTCSGKWKWRLTVFAIIFLAVCFSAVDVWAVPSYLVYEDGVNFYAHNTATGLVDYTRTDARTLLYTDLISNFSGTGGEITVMNGTYPITSEIILDKENIVLLGEGPSTVFTSSTNSPVFRSDNVSSLELGAFQIQVDHANRTSPIIQLSSSTVAGDNISLHNIKMTNTYHTASPDSELWNLGNDVGVSVGNNIMNGDFDRLFFDHIAYPIKMQPTTGYAANGNYFDNMTAQSIRIGVDFYDATGETNNNTFDNAVIQDLDPRNRPDWGARGFRVRGSGNVFSENVMYEEQQVRQFVAYEFLSGSSDNLVLGGEVPVWHSSGDAPTKIINNGTNNIVLFTSGEVYTERSGTLEADNGSWISFGMAFGGVPQDVIITVQESDAMYTAQPTGKTETGFILYLYDETAGALETTDKTISWTATYHVPEPATVGLLLFGFCMMPRRKICRYR